MWRYMCSSLLLPDARRQCIWYSYSIVGKDSFLFFDGDVCVELECSQREFVHIFPLCVLERRPEDTHGGAGMFAWVTSGSLPQSQITDLIFFQLPLGNINTPLHPHIFCLWLVIGTYILFPVICWSNLQTEIFVTPYTGNNYIPLLFFSFQWNHFVDVILRPDWIC